MKRFLFLFAISLIFFSCSYFEEDHEIKEGVRKYLTKTLHDPDSMEELNWSIRTNYVFKHQDSTDLDSPLIIDFKETIRRKDSSIEIQHVRLRYRAKNGFGAMRASELYATYYVDDPYLQFENIGYSYDLEGFIKFESTHLMNPRRLFLRNEFLLLNEGKATMKDFWKEYPEYN